MKNYAKKILFSSLVLVGATSCFDKGKIISKSENKIYLDTDKDGLIDKSMFFAPNFGDGKIVYESLNIKDEVSWLSADSAEEMFAFSRDSYGIYTKIKKINGQDFSNYVLKLKKDLTIKKIRNDALNGK